MMQIFAKKKNTATGSVELKETSDLNEHILNIITPSGIDYDSTHANIGEAACIEQGDNDADAKAP